jgi:hypothetical protein
MKPTTWEEVPHSLLHNLLWDMDLDYDPYESSKAEAIDNIVNGIISQINEGVIKSYWNGLSEKDFQSKVKSTKEELIRQLELLTRLESPI